MSPCTIPLSIQALSRHAGCMLVILSQPHSCVSAETDLVASQAQLILKLRSSSAVPRCGSQKLYAQQEVNKGCNRPQGLCFPVLSSQARAHCILCAQSLIQHCGSHFSAVQCSPFHLAVNLDIEHGSPYMQMHVAILICSSWFSFPFFILIFSSTVALSSTC